MRTSAKLLTLAATVGALALPAAASASSIVYIDGGNVWSSSPDGAHKVQLTDGGDWHSPTQSDDGTIAAAKGTDGLIRVMSRDGRPIRTIATAAQKSSDGGTFAPRPVELAFSPDGSKIAYSYAEWSCPPGSTCGDIQTATFVTDANVTTATPKETYGSSTGISNPEWVSPTRLVAAGGAGTGIALPDLGFSYETRNPWIPGSKDLGDPELTRDGKRLALTIDYGDNMVIAFTKTSGDPRTEQHPAIPESICGTSKDAKNADPTWSPDGNAAAYQSSKGIQTVFFGPGFDSGSCDVTSEGAISPTGSEPDWGPADPPAARYRDAAPAAPVAPAAPAKPATSVKPAASVIGAQAGGTSAALTAGAAATQRIGKLSVTCIAPSGSTCSAVAKVKLRGKTLVSKTATAAATGTAVTLHPSFSKKTLRSLRKALRRGTTATITVRATGAGSTTRQVKLLK